MAGGAADAGRGFVVEIQRVRPVHRAAAHHFFRPRLVPHEIEELGRAEQPQVQKLFILAVTAGLLVGPEC